MDAGEVTLDRWRRRWQDMTGEQFIASLIGDGDDMFDADHLGTRVIEVSPGRVELAWRPGDRIGNRSGSVHGGYVAMVLDNVCCLAGASLGERFTPMLTLSLAIDYLRPVLPGEHYAAAATVVHPSKRRMVVNGTVTGPNGLAAQATATITPNQAFVPPAGADQVDARPD